LQQLDATVRHFRDAAALADRIHPGNASRRARAYNNLATTLASANQAADADAAFAIAEGIFAHWVTSIRQPLLRWYITAAPYFAILGSPKKACR
jgi:hypothetical protein